MSQKPHFLSTLGDMQSKSGLNFMITRGQTELSRTQFSVGERPGYEIKTELASTCAVHLIQRLFTWTCGAWLLCGNSLHEKQFERRPFLYLCREATSIKARALTEEANCYR